MEEVEICGVKFLAKITADGSIITIYPQGKWSMSKSTSFAKEINIFLRSR